MPRNANQSKSFNYSLDFNGDFINIGNENYVTTSSFNISISAWINIDTTSGDRTIVASGQSGSGAYDYRLNVDTNNNVYFKARTTPSSPHYTTITGGTTLSTNTWYHVCATWDMANFNLYLNGVSDATAVSATTYFNDSGVKRLAIGYQLSSDAGGYRPFYGKINEVSIFDYALSQSQVTTLWGGGTYVSNPMALPSPPIAYYPLGTSAWNGQYLAENNAIGDYVFDFDSASSDYIDCGNAFTETGAFTVSAWINTTATASSSVAFKNGVFQFGKDTWYNNGTGNAPYLSITDSNGLNKTFRNGVAASGTTVTTGTVIDLKDGNWHNIAFTYDGVSQGKYYSDGVVSYTYDITDVSWAGTLASNSNDLLIGKHTAPNWTGEISNAQIWDTPLSSTEIETLYNYGSPIRTLANIPQSSNLQGWWKLDASDTYDSSTGNWTIEDHAGSNDGTSSGMSQANLVQSDLQTVAPYSKYAMNFDASSSDYIDCGNVLNNIFTGSSFSVSTWIYATTNTTYNNFFNKGTTVQFYLHSNKIKIYLGSSSSGIWPLESTATLSLNTWYNIVFTRSVNENKLYINGSLDNSATSTGSIPSSTGDLTISSYNGGSSYFWDGSMSNASIWDTALTSAQVTEIYNEGLPSNLNSHSAYSNLVSWWQLGENSSFDGNDWIVADEKGSNNGTSVSMPVGALTNGVGTTANGVSSGMSEGNLVGDAPYSTANALSSGMSVVSRVTDVAPSPPTLLLNTYTGSKIAYSLRKLDTNYTGNAIRVRRSSDNTEQDIGFTNNELDTTSLLSFVGSNDGYVTTWYDQSGNTNNATHSTAINQPLIVSSGVVNTINSRPSIKFNGSVKLNISTNNFAQSNSVPYTILTVSNMTSLPSDTATNGGSHIFGIGSASNGFFTSYGDKIGFAYNGGSPVTNYTSGRPSQQVLQDTNIVSLNSTQLSIYTRGSGTNTLSSNNNTPVTNTQTANPYPYSQAAIGASSGNNYSGSGVSPLIGNISECILWWTNFNSDRTDIKNNLNSFYTIY